MFLVSGTMEVIDIDTLTLEEYLAMTRDEQGPGLVRPMIGADVQFKIKPQFMRELREKPFAGLKTEDAYEHEENVLYITSLFNIPGVSHDAVMLRVFPMTLSGAAKRWVDRLPAGTINTWNLLKKNFIQRFCPAFRTAKQLKEIHNFRQEEDETLYQAWDRFNDLLYRCPTHDVNIQQKVNLFYKGINIATRWMVDSQGLIPGMTPARALDIIQDMADHSQKWHDGGSTRSTGGGLEGMNALTNQLENLGREAKKLKKSVHTIQVGCEICEGAHLAKDSPLRDEDDKKVEEVKYGDGRPFQGNSNGYRMGGQGFNS